MATSVCTTGDTGEQGESPGPTSTLSSPGEELWSTDTENPRLTSHVSMCNCQYVQGPNRAPSCGNSFPSPRLLVTYDPVSRAWGELTSGGQVTLLTPIIVLI